MQRVYGCLISLGQLLSLIVTEIMNVLSVVYLKGSSENLFAYSIRIYADRLPTSPFAKLSKMY